MGNREFVAGVGTTKLERPGRRAGWDDPEMARESGGKPHGSFSANEPLPHEDLGQSGPGGSPALIGAGG